MFLAAAREASDTAARQTNIHPGIQTDRQTERQTSTHLQDDTTLVIDRRQTAVRKNPLVAIQFHGGKALTIRLQLAGRVAIRTDRTVAQCGRAARCTHQKHRVHLTGR